MNWIRKIFPGKFAPDGRYLVGVSGGRDSVALLRGLIDSGYKNLIVCHLNHQLRGRASNADARFVKRLTSQYDVDVAIGSTNIRALAAKRKMSIETAAREARYEFFAKIAKSKRCRTIFLGHQADDVVETFLINLFRGAGTTGLSSMREVSKRRIADIDLTIVRPLLRIWRSEIDRYVRAHRLKFREDASNKNLAPLRNRIRRRMIPYLEKLLGRNIRQSIWRAAMIAAEEENWIEGELSDPRNADLGTGASAKAALSIPKLHALPIALQRRAILKWLRTHRVANVGFDIVENVRAMLDRDFGVGKTNLPQDRHVRRRAKKIFITG
ncbi:MAG: tRNA lysidine(34) synthetase TilS [Verrucomicrobia bacterium]|nr:tRNA lysidine(34) synthetase TilS [Verrucomicrobiota bacterium]